jgi:hypothetical protein
MNIDVNLLFRNTEMNTIIEIIRAIKLNILAFALFFNPEVKKGYAKQYKIAKIIIHDSLLGYSK